MTNPCTFKRLQLEASSFINFTRIDQHMRECSCGPLEISTNEHVHFPRFFFRIPLSHRTGPVSQRRSWTRTCYHHYWNHTDLWNAPVHAGGGSIGTTSASPDIGQRHVHQCPNAGSLLSAAFGWPNKPGASWCQQPYRLDSHCGALSIPDPFCCRIWSSSVAFAGWNIRIGGERTGQCFGKHDKLCDVLCPVVGVPVGAAVDRQWTHFHNFLRLLRAGCDVCGVSCTGNERQVVERNTEYAGRMTTICTINRVPNLFDTWKEI